MSLHPVPDGGEYLVLAWGQRRSVEVVEPVEVVVSGHPRILKGTDRFQRQPTSIIGRVETTEGPNHVRGDLPETQTATLGPVRFVACRQLRLLIGA
ncbi:hypothetical protein GCM10027088_62820 [Nocardia goodfellowii]